MNRSIEETFQPREELWETIRPYDMVDNPKHYMIMRRGEKLCEVRDVQESVSANLIGIDASDMNNAVKYLLRSPFKHKRLEDLKKARFMIDAMIERLEVTKQP